MTVFFFGWKKLSYLKKSWKWPLGSVIICLLILCGGQENIKRSVPCWKECSVTKQNFMLTHWGEFSRGSTNAIIQRTKPPHVRQTNLNWRRALCEYTTTIGLMLGKNELPKHKRNARVFERAKHKTTSCAPYKREKIVLSTIIMFCPMNLDKTNLRKQTRVHLLWG